MTYYTTTHADVAESFLLGLSCLVGGDQFYILVSKTDASPKTQSYIAITTVLSTLFLAFVFYDEYNRSLFDVTHVLYLVLLVIWGLILYQNVRNPFVTTYYVSILGMVMTFLVIISCVHYSYQKELLASFLSGMLFARLLPTLLWIFVHQKKAEPKLNLSSLSARLAFFRLAFCISAMILKFTSGTLDFSGINVGIKQQYDWHIIRAYAFTNFAEHFMKLFIRSFTLNQGSVLRATIFLLFFSSLVLHLGFPPILYRFAPMYSQQLYSRIDVMRTVSHLLGVALGTKYPVSKTTKSYYFAIIYFGYGVYVCGSGIGHNYFQISSTNLLYTILILTGFVLGYVWSYSLIMIKSLFFVRTCVHEEFVITSCCGDKIESQCYCRLESVAKLINSGNSDENFSCSKLYYGKKRLRYSQDGQCAILLMYNTDDSACSKICESSCDQRCSAGNCCLKLVGIYKIESVTTNTCKNCQLTIRIEASCTDQSKCPSCCTTGQEGCTCKNGDKCCLCLKCCKPDCNSNCKCCIHLCKCTNGCQKCCIRITNEESVRVFICFRNGSNQCCIKEIRPNSSKKFTDDLKIQNEFDIKGVSFFDCCHVNLTVDLQCTMKNNFFRVSSINYPKKTIRPLSLTLVRNGIECCKTDSGTNCCCKNSDLVTVCVKYDGSEKNCKIECTCKGGPGSCCCRGTSETCSCCTSRDGNCCCCCVTCELNVNKLSYFYEKVEPIRVKLIIILWLFFLLFLMIVISQTSKSKAETQKYFKFFPIRSFEIVNKELESNGMNSMHSVLERLSSVQQNIFLQLFGEKDKKTDLDHMLQLCECVFDPCSLNTLRHYVLSRSSMLISSPHYINRRINLELVKWSYCVGFIYTYIMLMFFNIQDYFLKWEKVWIREYLNYRRIMTRKFNNLTKKSKSSISFMCENGVDHKAILYTDQNRNGGWGCGYTEIDIYTNLHERELEMNKPPPYRLDLRLLFYLDRWKHRVENLIFLIQSEINIYDWTGLMKEYPRIKTWVFKFLPHIHSSSPELDIPINKLNKGTEILESKTLNLVS